MDSYQNELDAKVAILEGLLTQYDDGRRKGFFCLAVNLLELEDLRHVVEQLAVQTPAELPQKERAASAVGLFQAMAEERSITLQLRKKARRQ